MSKKLRLKWLTISVFAVGGIIVLPIIATACSSNDSSSGTDTGGTTGGSSSGGSSSSGSSDGSSSSENQDASTDAVSNSNSKYSNLNDSSNQMWFMTGYDFDSADAAKTAIDSSANWSGSGSTYMLTSVTASDIDTYLGLGTFYNMTQPSSTSFQKGTKLSTSDVKINNVTNSNYWNLTIAISSQSSGSSTVTVCSLAITPVNQSDVNSSTIYYFWIYPTAMFNVYQ